MAQLRREALGPPPGRGPDLDLSGLDPAAFDIPVVVEPEVHAWVSYWAGDGCRWFARRLARVPERRQSLERILEAAGLPRDLVALPMIESGLLPDAVSAAGARGEWQLMPATARGLGLRVDADVDERKDPYRSAVAGARYLASLARRFPNLYLAWAAYNAGPETIAQAVRAGGTEDYWALARSGRLSPEAANYVPKVLAAAILAKDPARFGLPGCAGR